MAEITEELAQFVRDRLASTVEGLLDDPHGVFGTGTPEEMSAAEIMAYVKKLDRIAELVGMSMSTMVSKGKYHEVKRLTELVNNARVKASQS